MMKSTALKMVGITPEAAVVLADVKSFSPGTGIALAATRDDLDEKIKEVGDASEIGLSLRRYREALDTVIAYAIVHQGVVIEKLRILVEKRSDV